MEEGEEEETWRERERPAGMPPLTSGVPSPSTVATCCSLLLFGYGLPCFVLGISVCVPVCVRVFVCVSSRVCV